MYHKFFVHKIELIQHSIHVWTAFVLAFAYVIKQFNIFLQIIINNLKLQLIFFFT